MKIKKPKVRFNKARNNWVVDLRYHGEGREFYATKTIAQSRADVFYEKLFKFGNQAGQFDLPANIVLETKKGLEELQPFNASVLKACEFYAAHLAKERELQSCTVETGVDKWLKFKSRGQISKDTLVNYKTKIKVFCREFGNRPISEVLHDDIHAFLLSLKGDNGTRNDQCAIISMFFTWCIKQRLTRDNPAKGISFKVVDSEVSILSIDDAQELYEAAKASDPDVLRYVILCLFVGLRPKAEAMKVVREDLSSGHEKANIKVISGKTGRLRYVRLEEGVYKALISTNWSGKTYSNNFRRRWDELRYKLGYKIWLDPKYAIPERPKGIRLKEWPHDVMRHTYCSYHLAAFENEPLTVHCAGHDFRMFRKHYKKPLPKSEGERFWALVK